MNILLVANRFPPTAYGGVENYTYHLAKGLIGMGNRVHVFCRETDTSLPDYEVINENIDGIGVTRVINDYKNLTHLTNTYIDENIEALYKSTLAEISPDLVHIHHTIALSARLPKITAERKIPPCILPPGTPHAPVFPAYPMNGAGNNRRYLA